jgi:energy-coupling factor transporter ATP-binding protein EcfA2
MSFNLRFQSKYKSIDQLNDIELPDFTVITGINGSGKSQLLEAINQSSNNQNRGIKVFSKEKQLSFLKHVTANNLVPNNSGIAGVEELRNLANNIITEFKKYKNNLRGNPNTKIDSVIGNKSSLNLIEIISKNANKNIEDLENADFYKHYPVDDGLIVADVFQHQFSNLFKRYQTKYEENRYNEYVFNTHGEGSFFTDNEFIERYGPKPWYMVNRVLEESKVNYRVNNPESIHRDEPFTLELTNQASGTEVNFSDLSSGEKVLVSLAVSLYNLNLQVDFPEVLLMDEPDGPLHPSMTKHFIEVLRKVFIQEKGVKVILTTHSASTVALSPEESIYVMTPDGDRLRKTSKDQALSILTSGVPALSVNYENRRQVFVESKYDQIFYELLDRKVSSIIPSEISLNFLCAKSDGSSGCDEVKSITEKLVEYGNTQVFGLIDWDLSNSSSDKVIVLGENKRYSIENYLLDPVAMIAFLIRERMVLKSDYGLTDNESYFDIKDFDQNRIQSLVDIYMKNVDSIKPENPDDNLSEYKLMSGKKIKVPNWYFLNRGHDLEEGIKETFPQLNRYQREGEFKKEMITKVFEDLPEIIPQEIIDLLESLRNS